MKNHITNAKNAHHADLPAPSALLARAPELVRNAGAKEPQPSAWQRLIKKARDWLARAEKRITENFRVPPNGG